MTMVVAKRIVLDVLKPHLPNALDFCQEIARLQQDYRVLLTVLEMDEDTQTLQLEISGNAVELGPIEAAITSMGASVHSIDQVEVVNQGGDG
jgi:hypothetical protein